ncbi:hypothetical protein KFE25_005775 [Diacronema lutheri]|uniref:Uncharacterized protein n=1 Tax=Diacronema lutheri TaxID=2081491 RepID=A0A8J6C0C2_DIALT|nr:hypothetical protein KFE25_005775 [Diacronema lutheri]
MRLLDLRTVSRRAGAAGVALLGVLLAAGLRAIVHARRRAARAAAACPRLAIVVVTSPAPCHPSTALLEELLDSLAHVPALLAAPLTIVCDGVKLGSTDRLKRGICSHDLAARYREYVRRLRALIAAGDRPWSHATIVELAGRGGFGFAVRQGMLYRDSRYVLVLQHDRPFVRGFDLDGVLGALDAHGDRVKYVCLPTHSTHAHPELLFGRHRLRLPGASRFGAVELAPLAFWYDSTHIVPRKHCLEFVFGFGGKQSRVRRGQFPEETLGTAMMADITAHGFGAHAQYATWVLVDALAPAGAPPGAGRNQRRTRAAMYRAGFAALARARGDVAVAGAPSNDSCGDDASDGTAGGAPPFVPVVVHSDGRSDKWCEEHAERRARRADKYAGVAG